MRNQNSTWLRCDFKHIGVQQPYNSALVSIADIYRLFPPPEPQQQFYGLGRHPPGSMASSTRSVTLLFRFLKLCVERRVLLPALFAQQRERLLFFEQISINRFLVGQIKS